MQIRSPASIVMVLSPVVGKESSGDESASEADEISLDGSSSDTSMASDASRCELWPLCYLWRLALPRMTTPSRPPPVLTRLRRMLATHGGNCTCAASTADVDMPRPSHSMPDLLTGSCLLVEARASAHPCCPRSRATASMPSMAAWAQ